MKILKIFGIVVGIHVFALVLIFANPGCSASTKPAPMPADTAMGPSPSVGMPSSTPSTSAPANNNVASAPAPGGFNPDAPAVAPSASSATSSNSVRFTPTRPGSPAATTLVTEPVADVTPATTYTVKAGDSLWTIAKKHNLTVAQLSAANSLSTNATLKQGQKLLLPGKPASPTVAATANPAVSQGKTAETVAPRPAATTPSGSSGGTVKHIVKPGETLGEIARNYGVKARDIMAANYISDPAKIKANAELIIPGWDAPQSKSGKSGTTKSTPPAASTKSTPPPVKAETTPPPAQTPPPQIPQVPVISIDEGSPIVPAPKR